MNTPEPAPPRVRLESIYIETLFQEIEAGELRLPRYLRPFVWRPEDMLALFDSIRKGYPIGGLLFWQTDEDVRTLDQIGPIPIPPRENGSVAYVLDGQQRLATLYGVLRLAADFPQGPKQEQWQWWIYYDLKEHRFLHAPRGAIAPEFLPLRAILRTSDFLDEARRLSAAFGDVEGRRMIDEGQSLAQRVKAHQLSVTRIQGGTLDQTVEIFSRLNTTGQKLTMDQITSALTYREGKDVFDFADEIDQIMEGLEEYRFGNLSRTIIFRTIALTAGASYMHAKLGEQLRWMDRDTLPSTVQRAKDAMVRAAAFLVDKLDVPGDRLLPYLLQFQFLAEFHRLCPVPSASQESILRRWFWATSFSGWFAGANPTQIQLALEEFRVLARQEADVRLTQLDDPCRPFPKTFDLHSARLRTFILFTIQRLQPREVTGELVDAKTLFFEHGSRAFAYVFRKAPAELVSSTANRVLLPVVRGLPARRQLLSLPDEHKDAILESHGIDDAAYAALQADDAAAFIKARAHHLAQLERVFMAELGLTQPPEEFGESDIDTGDD